MSFIHLFLFALLLDIGISLPVFSPTEITGFYCGWTNKDFYYRAIEAISLNVVYYSPDHSNVLDSASLTEINNIEQQIKSLSGYHEHALIYTEQGLYCECAPYSATNFIFPELYTSNTTMIYRSEPIQGDFHVWTGQGHTIYDGWRDWVSDYFDIDTIGQNIWFNRDTFTENNGYKSPFLCSVYSFGYNNENETMNDLNDFLSTFDKLLSGVTSTKISLSWSYKDKYNSTKTINFNEKNYEYIPPTNAPTEFVRCDNRGNCYQTLGYNTCSGHVGSTCVMTAVPTISSMNSTAPADYFFNEVQNSNVETCRATEWQKYAAKDDSNDMIYFDNYAWNIVEGDNEYYCKVLFNDISLCNNQWQDKNNDEYVQLELVIQADVGSNTYDLFVVVVHTMILCILCV